MITGASHTLHTNLTESLSYYRQQLDAQKLNQSSTPKNGNVSTLPAPAEPSQLPAAPAEPSQLPAAVPPKSYEVIAEVNQIPLSEQLKLAAEERRDTAREAAMAVESLQHKNDVINVYTNSSNAASDSSASSGNTVSPGEVYQETLNYQKRQDLMTALQQASSGEQLGKVVDITV
jgi:hypothetical protein